MKLYAKTNASRGGREAVKGDNTSLKIELSKGNKKEYLILYYDTFMHVYELVNGTEKGILILDTSKKGKTQKGESCEICNGYMGKINTCLTCGHHN